MLKKNYESVLKALDRAEAMKAQFADQAAESEHRVTEIQLQYQLQFDEVMGESILSFLFYPPSFLFYPLLFYPLFSLLFSPILFYPLLFSSILSFSPLSSPFLLYPLLFSSILSFFLFYPPFLSFPFLFYPLLFSLLHLYFLWDAFLMNRRHATSRARAQVRARIGL
jgi:hypothetical protein